MAHAGHWSARTYLTHVIAWEKCCSLYSQPRPAASLYSPIRPTPTSWVQSSNYFYIYVCRTCISCLNHVYVLMRVRTSSSFSIFRRFNLADGLFLKLNLGSHWFTLIKTKKSLLEGFFPIAAASPLPSTILRLQPSWSWGIKMFHFICTCTSLWPQIRTHLYMTKPIHTWALLDTHNYKLYLHTRIDSHNYTYWHEYITHTHMGGGKTMKHLRKRPLSFVPHTCIWREQSTFTLLF